ncbi:glycosyltransferase [Mangrovicoccus algicola]|uniref:Glycosyltransferase n=1 Tax=Mangrovicoccus algicola TaxID=2771008 RepID=A0A8J6ZGZ9_9RHOB|nr:glycosyltransferase [Mangrovicoccus algicola]MBE3640625.1 glycosyltransferase [Mangrovicoccus algicola]
MSRPVIVFAGAVYPGQFGRLCDYLREAGLAETYFLTTPGHRARNRDRGAHVLEFRPDGPITDGTGYYYAAKPERSARIGRGLLEALRTLQAQRPIDVVVAHSLWGAPHFLYGEIDAAIVSYIEFPSYRAHGWDPAYPPDAAQRMADRNTEMLHFHQALNSDLVLCPSHHAKRMFPEALQGRIEVQMEGFEIEPVPRAEPAAAPEPAVRPFTIGFAARDLSSAKGFDIYMRLAERIAAEAGPVPRFVAFGGAGVATYGYEEQWVAREYGGAVASFRDHLLRLHPRAAALVEFPGPLPYADFARALGQVDLFLYPLRHGVANWGLVEILARGGCVIAPDRGYAAELILDDVNGRLLPDGDEAWLQEIRALRADPARRLRYGRAAQVLAREFRLEAVAPRYLRLFRQAVERRRARLAQG